MQRPLSGRTALVTGGGTRLGRAIAEGLGRLGADVAVHFQSSEEGAKAALATLRTDGNRAEAFRANLTNDAELDGLVTSVEQALGPVSILVNSAALYVRAGFLETATETLDSQWALNARAPYLLTQRVAKGMVARGQGDVLNVLDIGGVLNSWRHYSAYAMTKAALGALTKSLAVELAPHVRVNGVAPGTVLPPTELGPEALEQLRQRIPQQRFGSPDDIVATVGFLLTGPAFVTGQIIAVDGGRSLA